MTFDELIGCLTIIIDDLLLPITGCVNLVVDLLSLRFISRFIPTEHVVVASEVSGVKVPCC